MKLLKPNPKVQSLNWNLLLAFFYFVQAVALIFLIDLNLSRQIDVTFLSQNLLTGNLQTTVRTIYDVNLGQILPIIPLIIGLFHLVFGVKTKLYKQILKQKLNIWRWLINGLIYGLILAFTAMILGITDIVYLLLLTGSMFTFSWLGLIAEYIKTSEFKKTVKKSAVSRDKTVVLEQLFKLIFGLQKLNGLIPWLLLSISLLSGALLATSTAVWGHYLVYVSGLLLLLFCVFNAGIYYKAIEERRYSSVEGTYFALNFIFISSWLWLIATAVA